MNASPLPCEPEHDSALGSSEEYFRSLIENALDVITILDSRATILYESPAVRRVLGYQPAELVGTNALGFVHPDDQKGVLENLGQVLQDKPIQPIEFRFRHKDGSWRSLESVGSRVTLKGDGIANPCVIVNSRDVTTRQRAEQSLRESEARKGAILETSLDCIITIDSQSRILEWNPAAETTFGYTRAEVAGQTLQDLIVPPELREAHRNGLKRYVETGVGPVLGQRLELPAVRRDGSRITVELAIVPIPGCDPPLFTGHLRDVTARIETQQALQQAKDEAEEARESAERANHAKSEFLSRVSHELRTPLNAILGFAQLLQMDALPPEHAEMVGDIHHAGKHLLSLINEVLDIARIEEGHLSLSLEPVALSAIVADNLSLMAPLAARRGLRVRNTLEDNDYYVLADRRRLNQILVNLLSNAVKYNRDLGEVTVSCEVRGARAGESGAPTSDEGWICIKVCDTGKGIPAEVLDQLFTPFARLGAERTEIEGTGLGLALTKRLVEAMGGRIGVDTVYGVGSTFRVELPPAQEPASLVEATRLETVEPPAASGNSHLYTLLYIEDNAANFKVIERLLSRRPDLRLLHAVCGEDGWEVALRERPALILLDVHLPDIDGSEVLRRLREDERTCATPVIVLSADATPARISRLMQEGADDYLTKPLDIPQFLSVIRLWLDENNQHYCGRERRDGTERRKS